MPLRNARDRKPRRVSAQLGARKRNPAETKSRILISAVRHFGEYGYEGASLRNILADAGVSLASANYHFGSKAKLLEATIDRYMVHTRDRRMSLLIAATRAPLGRCRVRALAEAYIRPHVEMVVGEREHDYGRFVFRMAADGNTGMRAEADAALVPIRHQFRDALRACAPNAGDRALATGIAFVVSVLAMAPFEIDPQTLAFGAIREEPVEAVLASAVDFAYGGLVQILGLADEPAT